MRALAGTRREKLTLANGIPVTIALEFANGKRVPSRIPGAPDQIYYSLQGSREMYVPLEVGRVIEELGLRPGEAFTLCKYGPQNYDVERAQKSEGSGITIPAPSRVSGDSSVASVSPAPAEMTKLESALRTAILAASNAEKYGEQIGYAVRFDTDAIKSMAITVLINMDGGRK